jgi:L,D-transpeptidase YcbB
VIRTVAIGLALAAAAGAAWAEDEGGSVEARDAAAIRVDGAAAPLEPDRLDAALASAGREAGAVRAFYERRGFAPYWSESGREENLLATFADAARLGLPEDRYALRSYGATADADAAEREAALTRAFLRYARDLRGGLVDPASVDSAINVSPVRPDPEELLTRLEREPLLVLLATLIPHAAEYRALAGEMGRLESLAASGGWGEPVPEGATLRRGDVDPRVAALRARLAARGYPETAEGDADRFDGALENALKAFQAESGLIDDGVAGARTLAALNAAPEERIDQILVNLERMRWLHEDFGDRYVFVNIPAFTTAVFEDGAEVYRTRSIVGEDRTSTPEFSDTMTYLVVNPTWYIPDSIARRVYLPQLWQDPGVLRRNNMRLFTRAGTEIDPGLVNFSALGDSFPFRVRQNPSASNALGRVKFMFPNQFAIYLHDTPNRELFNRDARAFSNGCVRLEDPFELAQYLLAPQLDDPEAAFRRWVDAGSERYVTLEKPIPVYLAYRTAWADADGVHFRADIYGRDAKLLAKLRQAGVGAPVRETAGAPADQAG